MKYSMKVTWCLMLVLCGGNAIGQQLLPPGATEGVVPSANDAVQPKPKANPESDMGSARPKAYVELPPPVPSPQESAGPMVSTTTDVANKFFGRPTPTHLSRFDRRALEIDRRWKDGEREDGKPSETYPVPGPSGTVMMLFGEQQPSIVCAVFQVCDVALQKGEKVNSVHLGDATRWVVDPAITGEGLSATQHLVIKPLDVGLETSMVVATNRRTYHFRMKSDRDNYMSSVAFNYPEELQQKWEYARQQVEKEIKDSTIPETKEYLGNLDFGYEIIGDAPWKPTRVYNDGIKTIIDMPPEMAQTEAPMLLVIRRDSTMFSNQDRVMVNYRVQKGRYIVDSVFDKAIMVTGVGKHKTRVTIARRPAKP
jgi:type IV secretion system protein VirB9